MEPPTQTVTKEELRDEPKRLPRRKLPLNGTVPLSRKLISMRTGSTAFRPSLAKRKKKFCHVRTIHVHSTFHKNIYKKSTNRGFDANNLKISVRSYEGHIRLLCMQSGSKINSTA